MLQLFHYSNIIRRVHRMSAPVFINARTALCSGNSSALVLRTERFACLTSPFIALRTEKTTVFNTRVVKALHQFSAQSLFVVRLSKEFIINGPWMSYQNIFIIVYVRWKQCSDLYDTWNVYEHNTPASQQLMTVENIKINYRL